MFIQSLVFSIDCLFDVNFDDTCIGKTFAIDIAQTLLKDTFIQSLVFSRLLV
jgi:hypothetical protein